MPQFVKAKDLSRFSGKSPDYCRKLISARKKEIGLRPLDEITREELVPALPFRVLWPN